MKRLVLLALLFIPLLINAQGIRTKQIRATGESLGRVVMSNGSGVCIFGNVIDSMKIENDTLKIWAASSDTALAVDLSGLAGSTDTKMVLVSANDTNEGYLEDKLVASEGTNTAAVLEITTLNDGADEDLQIQIDLSKISTDDITEGTTNLFDQVVTLSQSGIINITGSYPNFTISATETDGSITNELQTISTDGEPGDISISSGNNITLNVDDADADPTNELQQFDIVLISGDTLKFSLTGDTSVYTIDLSALKISIDSIYQRTTTIKYGYLYNWYAATDSREITSSSAWSVPSLAQYQGLADYLGASGDYYTNSVGGLLKETGTVFWNSPNTGATNSTGFSAVGTGQRSGVDGSFANIGNSNILWTSTEAFAGVPAGVQLSSTDNYFICPSGAGLSSDYGYALRLASAATGIADGVTTTYVGNDGKAYNAICINEVYWTTENLAETLYRNGDTIPEVTDGTTWAGLSTGALCSYSNDATNALLDTTIYGFNEVDPVFTSSPAASITASDISTWNTGGTDDQTLSLDGNTISIEDGNSVDVSTATAVAANTAKVSFPGFTSLLSDYSFTDNSTNWNTAYGWGDHSLAGYLTAETDPIYSASEASNITATDITNLGNLSGTNTGDQDLSSYYNSLTDLQTAVSNDFHNLGGTDAVNDADYDPANEIQVFDVSQLTGTTLELSLSNDGEATHSIDLSSLQDGTGTDDQTASEVPYTNTTSGLTATDVQAAIDEIDATVDGLSVGGGAPADATYITQTADATLTNEQALSSLSTGFVKVTSGTGVLSSVASLTATDVSDFDAEVSNNTDVSANTAKVSNATHSGEVAGATTLTISDNVIDYGNIDETLKQASTDNDGSFDFSAAGQYNCSISTNTTFSFSNISVNKNLKIKLTISSSATVSWNSTPLDIRGDAISGNGTYLINIEAWGTTESDLAVTVRAL